MLVLLCAFMLRAMGVGAMERRRSSLQVQNSAFGHAKADIQVSVIPARRWS
jgi:hypothetical protein